MSVFYKSFDRLQELVTSQVKKELFLLARHIVRN